MKKDSYLTIRLPEDVKEALRVVANAEDRSLASQVLVFIRQGLREKANETR